MGFIKSQAPAFMVQRGLLLVEALESPYCLRLKAHEQEMSEKRTGPTWLNQLSWNPFRHQLLQPLLQHVFPKCMELYLRHTHSKGS